MSNLQKDQPDLSIIIPVYNEIENIEALFQELIEVLGSIGRSYEILVVDDGSTDGSFEELIRMKEKYIAWK